MDQQIASALEGFTHKRILVVGDFILDNYIQGYSKRISPEAPIPVVDVLSQKSQLGGAANVALNLLALTATPWFCTVVGTDAAGEEGLALMRAEGLNVDGVVVSKQKKTQSKTRIVAGAQPIVRFDLGDSLPLDSETEEEVLRFLERAFPQVDGVLIADYEKGMLTEGVLQALVRFKARSPKFIAVDSKRLDAFAALQPDLVKPNFEEAQALLGQEIAYPERLAVLKSCGASIYSATKARNVALTLDQDGALWFREGVFQLHAPIPFVDAPKVNGAGDTFMSSALLAFLSRCDLSAASELANAAAYTVIQKEGTATCSRQRARKRCSIHGHSKRRNSHL